MLESFIISCWLLKGKQIGIRIGQFAQKKSVSESATKNHDRCITKQNYGLSAINNSLTTNVYSSISCKKKYIYSTFLVDEEVISRDFKQQLRMERLR